MKIAKYSCFAIGTALLLAALFLVLHNVNEDKESGEQAVSILSELRSEIPEPAETEPFPEPTEEVFVNERKNAPVRKMQWKVQKCGELELLLLRYGSRTERVLNRNSGCPITASVTNGHWKAMKTSCPVLLKRKFTGQLVEWGYRNIIQSLG